MIKIKKIFLCLIIAIAGSSLLSAQDLVSENSTPEKGFKISPYFNIGTQITLNLASKQTSAPSPVNFYIGGGAIIPLTEMITLEPHLDFWMMYYLFDGKDALPAEVEHRTATALCFMLDVPVGFNFKSGNHTFTPGAGLGLFMRFAILSNGVKPDDYGITGTAKSDNEKIGEWFWSNMRFLYPEIFFSWDYKVSDFMRAGLTAKVYFPIGQLFSGNGMDGMIFNLTSRFVF